MFLRFEAVFVLKLLGCLLILRSASASRISRSSALFEEELFSSPEPIESPEAGQAPDSNQLAEEAAKVVPQLQGDSWQRFAAYPLRVSESQGAILDFSGKSFLIVTGGYLYGTNYDVTNQTHTYELFDGVSGTEWVRRADMPTKLTHVAQVAVGGMLYTCGGYAGKHPGPSVRDCFVYNITSDTWKELPSLPHRRAGGGMVYVKKWNALFFAGGAVREAGEEEGIDFDDSYLLELSDMKSGWKLKASFQNPRNHMSAIEVDGKYFFVGGQHGANEETGNQKSLNEYVASENKWYKKADMPYGIGHLSASTPRWGGGFLVIGGVVDGREKSDGILFYDMLNNSWIEVGRYARNVQTPVCGITENTIFCSSGAGDVGSWDDSYMRGIGHHHEDV